MKLSKRNDSPRSASGSRSKRKHQQTTSNRTLLLILLLTICGLGMASMLFSMKQVNAARQKDGGSTNGISDQAQLQIKALLEEKESRTAVQKKIDSNLLYAEKKASGLPIAPGVDTLETTVKFGKENITTVDITTNQTVN